MSFHHRFALILIALSTTVKSAEPPTPVASRKPSSFTATLEWRIPKVGPSWGTPAFYKDYVIFGNTESDEYQNIASVVQMHLMKDGTQVWKKSHANPKRGNLASSSAINGPFCINGRFLYYQAGNGELVCIDLDESALSGIPSVRWSVDIPKVYDVFKRDSSGARHAQPGPVVADGVVCICTGNGSHLNIGLNVVPKPQSPSFMAFDALTGQLKWSSNAPGAKIMIGQWASPVIYNDEKTKSVLFCGGDGLLYRFDVATGKQLMAFDANFANAKEWKPDERGERLFASMSPVVAGDKAYVAMGESPDPSGKLRSFIAAIDLKNQKLLWRSMFPDDEDDYYLATPVVLDGVVYALTYRALFVAVDEKTGRVLWSVKRPAGDISAGGRPILHGGYVWAPTGTGIYRFGCGRQMSRYETLEINEPKTLRSMGNVGEIKGTITFNKYHLVFFDGDDLMCVKLDQ